MHKGADIHYVGFNKYTKQEVKENDYRNMVFNGKNNDNYKYIIERYNGSTTNKAVNNAYINLAYGRGLALHDEDEDSPLLLSILEHISKKDIKGILTDNQILGEHCFQVHRQRSNKSKLAKLEHLDKSKVIPSVTNEFGVIKSYWYSADWDKQWQAKYKPVEYPAFGYAKDFNFEKPEIYVSQGYEIGQQGYFKNPDYDACLQYAEIEEEISNYYNSHVHNGMSFGTIVNVPNSRFWSDAEKDKYKKDVLKNGSGSSNAGRIVFAFLDDEDKPTTISNIENNKAHQQWDFLTRECREKILSGHLCTSSSLIGINTSTGFSSNAQEMEEMRDQLLKYVIAPKQESVLDSLQEVFEYFKIDAKDLYFRPLTEIEGEDEEVEKVNEDEEVVELSKKKNNFDYLEDYAEDEPKGYELHSIDYDIRSEINLSAISNSEQDTKLWKVRYAYNKGTSKTPKSEGRSFCSKMLKLSESGKVFRKEDIDKMSSDGVNGQFAHEGGKYDIFLYAGGINCYHRWERRIYKKKRDEDGNPLGGNAMQNTFPVNVSEARRQGFTPTKNPKDVAIAEIDKPNKGAYPS